MAVDSKTKPEAQPAPESKNKRAERLAKATNVTFSLEPKVRVRLNQLAKAQGLDLGHFMQKLVETHILDAAPAGDDLADRLTAKRAVIEEVVKIAQDMDAQGSFDEHFVLTVMKAAAGTEGFMELYHVAIGGEGKSAARAQKPLNQQLGRLIRKAVGAKGKKSDKGTVMRAQVSGEIISSYTLLTKTA